MTTFALVHGGGHGGWCWERVAPLLESRGYQVVTPDLPINDVKAGATQWAAAVVDALRGCGDDIVVVGHSMGGLAIPIVATMRPVRHLVFLGALVPVPGRAFGELMADYPDSTTQQVLARLEYDDIGRVLMPRDVNRELFYGDCPIDVADSVWERLRPQAFTIFAENCPLLKWPDTPCSYILMQGDRTVGPAWSRQIAPLRMGVTPIELPGSHSPFYSRPAQLTETLIACSLGA